MAAFQKQLSARAGGAVDGAGLTVGIVHTRWNKPVVDALVDGCRTRLEALGVVSVPVVEVPGSYELPYAASRMVKAMGVDAVVCIGCLVKGETMHFEYICQAVSSGLMRVQLDAGVPCMFGVLCCLTQAQALARAGVGEGSHNHGPEWADSAVEMANLRRRTGGASACPYLRGEAGTAHEAAAARCPYLAGDRSGAAGGDCPFTGAEAAHKRAAAGKCPFLARGGGGAGADISKCPHLSSKMGGGHGAAAAKCPFLAGKQAGGGAGKKKRPAMIGGMPVHCLFYTAGLAALVGAVGYGLTCLVKGE